MGSCCVEELNIYSKSIISIKRKTEQQDKQNRNNICTIILQGPSDAILAEAERVHNTPTPPQYTTTQYNTRQLYTTLHWQHYTTLHNTIQQTLYNSILIFVVVPS